MIEVRRGRIDVQSVVDSVRRADAGAIVAFLGTVRADPGVGALDYEVYRPMAVKALQDLSEIAKAKFGILDLSVVHRIGRVPVGSDSVVIACAAGHRKEAFAACAWLMDEVKRVVPIWKTEAARGPSRSARKPRRVSR
ncbi:MAG TPA: molybdenum cofactor biosynthesis protein MoaE [Thermoplasmata archaeon]|nr:molybdenum cofactor biosynthesis protein MoaE [Thermoplasmata archaeon]